MDIKAKIAEAACGDGCLAIPAPTYVIQLTWRTSLKTADICYIDAVTAAPALASLMAFVSNDWITLMWKTWEHRIGCSQRPKLN